MGRAGVLELPDAALQVMRATGLDQPRARSQHLPWSETGAELAMVLARAQCIATDEPTARLIKSERSLIGDSARPGSSSMVCALC